MLKNIHLWLPSYVKQQLTRKEIKSRPIHLIFTVVDHFEPKWGKPSSEVEAQRVDTWVKNYPNLASKHKDSDGCSPRHTFFYPEEEYSVEHITKLSRLCREGFGEIEIHLHHDNDTADGLRKKIEEFKVKLESHGLLSRDADNRTRYGFIHGNWSLDNSRKDGKWCGVNNELEILNKTGCYADFTLPSAPSDTQTAKINSIYYAKDTPKPKSHDRGIDVAVGGKPWGDLMIIQGPLALNWTRLKIENGEITLNNPPTPDRIELWVEQRIGVKGRPDWIFVKVHTHGAQDDNTGYKFFNNLDAMFGYLETSYTQRSGYRLHYATAREMYNIVKAAESGNSGEPGEYRDFVLKSNIKSVSRTSYSVHSTS